jgi:O-antigen/teichoic acid export membrane protein
MGIDRKQSRDPLVRAAALSVVSRGTSLALSLVTGIIVARALGPEGKGVLAYVVTATNLVARLVSVGVEMGFTRLHTVKGMSAADSAGSVIGTALGLGRLVPS